MIHITLVGGREVIRRFERQKQKLGALPPHIYEDARRTATRNTPIKTGRLRRSIAIYRVKLKITVLWRAYYARVVDRKWNYMMKTKMALQAKIPKWLLYWHWE